MKETDPGWKLLERETKGGHTGVGHLGWRFKGNLRVSSGILLQFVKL